jgi:hypothetical protein
MKTQTLNEIRRRVGQFDYELSNNGVLFPKMGIVVGGVFTVSDADGNKEVCPNLITDQGLNQIINTMLPPGGAFVQITQWYIAPFSGNVTPDATWTAANFVATATEFTAYASATRPALTIASPTSTKANGNGASPADITFSAGGPFNVYGAAIVSVATKSSATGVMLAATRFTNPRLAQAAPDKLTIQYDLTATST